jgi:catechol-2,3-dioxygenase
MIGKLRSVVLDTRDPRLLASFYAAVLGGEVEAEDDTWVVLTDPTGRRVTDAVGEDHFRVYRDPAGHPFCLVWGVAG